MPFLGSVARLAGLVADPATPGAGALYLNLTTGLKWHDGTSWHTEMDLESVQTVTANKTFSGTVSINTLNLLTNPLARASGGTGSGNAFVPGGLAYGVTASAMGTSAAGSAGQLLLSGGSGAPTWTAADMTAMPSSWVKESVLCATTTNITLSGSPTVDGLGPTPGQRVLVKNQTAPAENGIYVAAAGAWTRAPDADLSSRIACAMVNVDNGTQSGTIWTTTFKTIDTLGTTAMTWTQLGAAGGGGDTLLGTAQTFTAQKTFLQTATGTTPLIAKSMAGASVDIFSVINSSSFPLFQVKSNGQVGMNQGYTATVLGTATVHGTYTAIAAQTSDFLQFKDSAGTTVLSKIDVIGKAWLPELDITASATATDTAPAFLRIKGVAGQFNKPYIYVETSAAGMIHNLAPAEAAWYGRTLSVSYDFWRATSANVVTYADTGAQSSLRAVRVSTSAAGSHVQEWGTRLTDVNGVDTVNAFVTMEGHIQTVANFYAGLGTGSAGAVVLSQIDTATSGVPNQSSGTVRFRTSRWNGAAGLTEEVTLQAVRRSTTTLDQYLLVNNDLRSQGSIYADKDLTVGLTTGAATQYLYMNAIAAISGFTVRDSHELVFRTSRWNGTAAVTEAVTVKGMRGSVTAGDFWLNVDKSIEVTGSVDASTDLQVASRSVGRGMVASGYAVVTATVATTNSTTTLADIVGLSVTVTLSSTRRYKVTLVTHPRSSVANDRGQLAIADGATVLQTFQTGQFVTAASGYPVVVEVIMSGPTSGSHTIKGQFARFSGTGVITIGAAATAPAFILVEDIGPNP